MTEKLWDVADVGAAAEHRRRAGVADAVREESLFQSRDLRHAVDHAVERLLGEWGSVDREKKARLRRVGRAQHVWPRFGEVLADEVRGDFTEWHHAILLELSLQHSDVAAFEIDVAHAKTQQLHVADAGRG